MWLVQAHKDDHNMNSALVTILMPSQRERSDKKTTMVTTLDNKIRIKMWIDSLSLSHNRGST